MQHSSGLGAYRAIRTHLWANVRGDGAAARHRELRTLVVLSALMSFASISTDMYLPAFPRLAVELRGAPGSVELTLSAFLAGFSLAQLLWGPIGDRYGRRTPIALGLVLFVFGSAGCAMSATVLQMTVWRVVQAIGACAGPVLARAMARDLYVGERSAQMLSTLMLIMGVAPLLGPLLGGQILIVWSWQGIFWTLAGFGLLALVGLLALPETLSSEQRITEPLQNALVGYFTLARNPKLMGYALSGAFFYAGMYVFIAGSPFAYIDYYRVPSETYGLLFGVNIAGMMATNFLNTRLVMRLGSERLFRFGTWVLAASGLVVALNARLGWGGLPGLVVPLFVYASMNGLVVANSVAGALSEAPHRAGTVSSLVGAMQYGSGVASAALVGWCADGTPWTMGWLMGAAGIGSLLTRLLLRC